MRKYLLIGIFFLTCFSAYGQIQITDQNTTPEFEQNQAFAIDISWLDVASPLGTFPDDYSIIILSGSNYSSDGSNITPDNNFTGTLLVRLQLTDGDAELSNEYDFEVTIFEPEADLSIIKSVNQGTPNVGSNVVFSITVFNGGPSDATNVVVTDNLPSGYTYVSDNGGAATTVNDNNVTWNIGSLANGASQTLEITATVLASGDYNNIATVSSTTDDPDDTNDSDNQSVTPNPVADLSIAKSVNEGTPNVGSNVVFSITVFNGGPSDATNVVVTDNLPSGYTYVSDNGGAATTVSGNNVTWNIGSLANGASQTLEITATVLASGDYNNIATVSSTTDDPDDTNVSDNQSVTPTPVADLSITKSVNEGTPNVGSNVVFTITVTNGGPSDATNVVVTDNLPSGYTYVSDNGGAATTVSGNNVTWNIGTMANGASQTLEITATVLASGDYNNIATVSSTTDDPDDTNDSDNQSVTPNPVADLSIAKSVNEGTPNVGSNVVFTITVTNGGPSDATNVVVTDNLPSGYTYVSDNGGAATTVSGNNVTWNIGTMANGASQTLEITATVLASGDYNNIATVSSTTDDPDDTNDSDNQSVTPNPVADLSIAKSVNEGTPNVGSNVVFTITVTNGGPSDATNVVVTDNLPSGYTYVSDNGGAATTVSGNNVTWNIGTMANGASQTLEITATVLASGDYNNIATVSSTTDDPDDTNDSDNQSVTPNPVADLSIAKSVNEGTPNVGSNVVFTITVTNGGPSDATNVVVTDNLPSGYTYVSDNGGAATTVSGNNVTWNIGTMANGASQTLEITATVLASGDYNNIATVSSTTDDPDDTNDSDNQSVTPNPVADLSIAKSVNEGTPNVGSNVVFSITVSNGGPSDATNVVVTDNLPSGYTYVSDNGGAATTVSGNNVTWNIGTMANGASQTLEITATVLASGDYNNIATVSSTTDDPDDTNDSDNQSVTPNPVADLSIAKSVNEGTPNVGSNVVFSITVSNGGPSDATNVVVTDNLPSGYTYVSDNGGAATTVSGNNVTWNIGTLANGASQTLEITATVLASGDYNNIATVSSTTDDPDDTNDSDNQSVTPNPVADLSIAKSVNEGTPNVGSNVVFTITVTNGGPSDATNVVVTDNLPSGYTYVSDNGGAATTVSGNNVTWNIGTMANGASQTLEITATVLASGDYNNIATVSSDTNDSNTGNNTNNQTLTPTPVADLSIAKSVNEGTPNVGSNVVFTITVTNGGPSDATNVVVNDNLPSGYTYVSDNSGGTTTVTGNNVIWNIGTMANGASQVLNITATVNEPTGTTDEYLNSASINGNEFDSNENNNNSQVGITPHYNASITLEKTGTYSDVTENNMHYAGDIITYSFVITNTGNVTLSNIVLKDEMLNLEETLASSIAPGNHINVGNKTYTITQNDIENGSISNTATVTAEKWNEVEVTANDSHEKNIDQITELQISIENISPSSTYSAVGEDIIFKTIVSNTGNLIVENVNITDQLTGLNETVTINPGTSTEFTRTFTVNQTHINAGSVHNEVNAEYGSTVISDNITVNATQTPQLTVVKTATPKIFSEIGDVIEYIITVTNSGNVTLENITVEDEDTGLSSNIASINPGTNNQFQTSYTITSDDLDRSYFTNTAKATFEFNGNSYEFSDYETVSANIADLTLTKTVDNTEPFVGDEIIFTLTVTNNGPDKATEVEVTDILPNGFDHITNESTKGAYNPATGKWLTNEVLVGETISLTITVLVKEPGTGIQYTNIAKAESNQFDPNPEDNEVSIAAPARQSELAISKDIDKSMPFVYDEVIFSITITNQGPHNATGVDVRDVVPAGYNNISNISHGGVLNENQIIWSNLDIAYGNHIELFYSATILPPSGILDEYTNIATITSLDQFDTDLSDNTVQFTPDIQNSPPVAMPHSKTIAEDTELSVSQESGLLSDATDADGDPINVVSFRISGTTYNVNTTITFNEGTIRINQDGSFVYMPKLNYWGTLPTIYYTISDGKDTAESTLNIEVTPVNDPPVANNNYLYTAENTPVNIDVLANDNDDADYPYGGIDPSSLRIIQQPENGMITILDNNTINFTPRFGFFGRDTAIYEICDLGYPLPPECSTAKIFIEVARLSPLAVDDYAELDEDTSVEINILANDIDPFINPQTVVIVIQPQHGTATYLGNGIVRYTPNPNYNGTDFFTYTVRNLANLISNEARVDITIHPVPDPPVAVNGWYTTKENVAVTIPIFELVSDPDDDIDFETIEITTAPNHGNLTPGTEEGTLIYTPDNGFAGDDSFQFRISDLTDLQSNIATVTIQVSDQAPTANDVEITIDEDETVVIDVLFNDTDPQDNIDPTTVTITIEPLHGQATPNPDGTVTYIPDENYFGLDSFYYRVCDETNYCDEAKVTITINPVNDPPVANDNEATLDQNTSTLVDVLSNDYDVDNTIDELTLSISVAPQYGTAEVNSSPRGIIYTPNPGYFGTDQFIYRLTDPEGLWDEATVYLTITWVNSPPEPQDNHFGPVREGGMILNVLENDIDPDDNIDPSTVTIVVQPQHGNITINSDGTIFFLPEAGYIGSDSFVYSVCDTEGACGEATVTLDIIAGNEPPVASDVYIELDEDTQVTFNPLDNDTDPNDNIDPASLIIITQPQNGVVDIIDGNGTVIYTPDPDYFGTDQFTYRICDDGMPVLCDEATVFFTIHPVNDAPRPQPNSISIFDGATATINVLENDFEPEGEEMTVFLISDSVTPYGEATLSADGTFTYTAFAGSFFRNDTIYYRNCDPHNACADSYVAITILPTDQSGDGIPDNLRVPAAFSPNDERNKYWSIHGLEELEEAGKPGEIFIYNRWGGLVFHENPFKNRWDGRASGNVIGNRELPEGVYYYILDLNGKVFKGSIYIKR
ncbi:Ig-like domain-containing protein [Alkalitalea saponilacus]|nr:Ig-like domain-containing protein [Alkalitalea saponilacus]